MNRAFFGAYVRIQLSALSSRRSFKGCWGRDLCVSELSRSVPTRPQEFGREWMVYITVFAPVEAVEESPQG